MKTQDNHDKPKHWCYGQDDGDLVKVEVVDLGTKANAELRNIYQNPTSLCEIGLTFEVAA